MTKLHYTHCPVCNSEDIHPRLTVQDHSVSHEEFMIWQCNNCSLRFTQDVPAESFIDKYYQSPDYISHTNTSTGLINKLYQKVRSFTLDKKAKLVITNTTDRGKILDLGAGIGAFLNTMQQKGWEIEGIEPDQGARHQARKLFDLSLQGSDSFEQLPGKTFDAISLWHVLEHVHHLHPYMKKLKELLKPGGKIFIAVPNYESLDSSIYGSFWAAYDVPRHLYHFTPESMALLVKESGLKILDKKPMWFDSFYISLLSSKYKNAAQYKGKGKPNWPGAIVSGLRSNFGALVNKDRCSSVIYIIGGGTE